MKPKSLILISAAIIISIFSSFKASYSQTSGPMASTVYSLAVSGSNILAGTESGIFKSSDNGKTWIQTSLYNQIAETICYNDKVIIAGIWFGGMYSSTNTGKIWNKLPIQENLYSWQNIVSISNVLFAGSSLGVYSSVDNGQHWVQTSFDSTSVRLITTNGSTIFAASDRFRTFRNRIFSSEDGAKNWKLIFECEEDIIGISASGSCIYLSLEPNEIYRSTDTGQNWTKLDFDLRCISLASRGTNVYVGTNFKGLYVSSDNGETWRNPLPGKSIFSIIANDSLIFCGTEKYGVYLSSDCGINWIQTSLINIKIKPLKFKEDLIIGHWDDFIKIPAMGGNLVSIIFSADSFYYHNHRYSDVLIEPCSSSNGDEYSAGKFRVDNKFIYLTGFWTDNTYKNVLTLAPCNSGKLELKYEYKYYSNHMLRLKLIEPAQLPYTGVKAELYLYKK